MLASVIITYGQFYKTCETFPHDEWISKLVAFISVVAGSPAPAKVRLNILAQPNPMHIFLHMSQQSGRSQQFTICCECLAEWDNLQLSGMDKTFLQTWIGQI